MSTALGVLNPFRYRGYVYDEETGLYYLQSRYYDPSLCRFISADVLLSTGQGVLGCNAFAYCANEPAVFADFSGNCPQLIPGCPGCKIKLCLAITLYCINAYYSEDISIPLKGTKAVVIYYDNDNPETSLLSQAELSIYRKCYSKWEPIKVSSYDELIEKWNKIDSETDDVFLFIHSDSNGFYMDQIGICNTDFSKFKPLDIKGDVYLRSCHARGFAERFAKQTKTDVVSTNSAVNYSKKKGEYMPRRWFVDRILQRNIWSVVTGK